ncbi:START domain-containing protein [Marinomonas balearica]|uniref:START domain-containing protein n=1 Tax=Marinomonas balearica TaxID=491947 RepID=A0A4R6M253_9GAMM|nr:START domain-containing protein [Marinomonas balearica]
MLLFTASAYSQEWKLYSKSTSVAVYSRLTEVGLEVKAIATVRSKPDALLKLLEDTDAASQWIANCKAVVVKARPSIKERLVHSYYNAPWPVRDRDMVTYSYVVSDGDGKGYRIEVTDVGQDFPQDPAYVRMEQVSGMWRIKTISDQRVQISYQGRGSAAGAIPKWLSNKLLLESTAETFENLTKMIVKMKYQKG